MRENNNRPKIGSKIKIPGQNFLTNHPMSEEQLNIKADFVIVSRNDWEKVIEFFENNPQYVGLIDK